MGANQLLNSQIQGKISMQSNDRPPTAKNSQQPINNPAHISTEGLDECRGYKIFFHCDRVTDLGLAKRDKAKNLSVIRINPRITDPEI